MVHNRWIKIITWLGIMAVLTLIAMGLWAMIFHAGQSTQSLKWLQFLQTIGTFLLPPILCAWIWNANHKPFTWLKMDKGADGRTFGLAILTMICAIPAINLLADINSRIILPECMAGIEARMRAMEESATLLTERFLQADNIGILLINIGLMAFLPALAEELSFRGTLQQILSRDEGCKIHLSLHLAIWLTAIVFSAIHLQFYGFVPRMLMGAMFGYVFVWTGSLWVPIVMHFTNNSLAVISYYIEHSLYGMQGSDKSYADTIGAGTTWWLGIISLILVGVLLYLTSQGPQGYDRRTHKE